MLALMSCLQATSQVLDGRHINCKISTITFPVFVQFVYMGLSGVPSLTETYRNFEAFLSVFLVLVKGDKLSLYGFVGNCNESNTFYGVPYVIFYMCVFFFNISLMCVNYFSPL